MTRNGFTLIELVVVIAVISILLAISTINFRNWVERQNIDREVKEMYADIMSLRQRAIVTGQNGDVAFPNAVTLVLKRYSSEAETRVTEGTVVQKKSFRYPVIINSAKPIEFTDRGMMIDPDDKIICIFTDANPSLDALVITQSRVSMGKIINQGSKNAASCTKANIEIK